MLVVTLISKISWLAKFVLFNHAMPEIVDRQKTDSTGRSAHTDEKHNELLQLAGKANLVASVGPLVYDYFDDLYRHFEEEPEHIRFTNSFVQKTYVLYASMVKEV